MKILLITSIYPTEDHPDYGTFVRNIHNLYQKSGHQVTLVAFQRSGGKMDKIKAVAEFLKKINLALKNQESFDLINLHYPYLAALPMQRWLKVLKIPLVVSVHGSDVFPDSFSKRMMVWPTTRILRHSTSIIVPSVFFQEKLIKTYDLPQANVRVVTPGGYNGDVFYPRKAGNAKTGRSHRIGFAGRLVEGKGWRDLMQAFAGLADKELKRYSLVIAGSGQDELKIRAEAKTLGIADQVELTGALSTGELAEFYRSLELFVFPSRLEESLGMVGIEALASGIPVIASSTGGIPGYLKDGVNGALVPPGDAEAIQGALRKLSTLSEADYGRMSQEAEKSAGPYEGYQVMVGLDKVLWEALT